MSQSQTGTPVLLLQRDTCSTLFLYPTPDAADTFAIMV